MKRFFNVHTLFISIALVALLCFVTIAAHARAGGGASVGRSAPTVSRSAPSYSAPRYSAPAVPAPYVRNQTTIIHNNGGNGGGSGAGGAFVGGMAGAVVGNALMQPHSGYAQGGYPVAPAPMAAAPVAGPDGQASYVQPVVVQSSTNGLWVFLIILGIIAIVVLCFFLIPLIYSAWRSSAHLTTSNGMDIDPLAFFYKLQDAAMHDDKTSLQKLCTPGMAMALSGKPEDGDAVKVFTGVTWDEIEEGCIEYRFTDTTDGSKVRERWQFNADDRLAGITVL